MRRICRKPLTSARCLMAQVNASLAPESYPQQWSQVPPTDVACLSCTNATTAIAVRCCVTVSASGAPTPIDPDAVVAEMKALATMADTILAAEISEGEASNQIDVAAVREAGAALRQWFQTRAPEAVDALRSVCITASPSADLSSDSCATCMAMAIAAVDLLHSPAFQTLLPSSESQQQGGEAGGEKVATLDPEEACRMEMTRMRDIALSLGVDVCGELFKLNRKGGEVADALQWLALAAKLRSLRPTEEQVRRKLRAFLLPATAIADQLPSYALASLSVNLAALEDVATADANDGDASPRPSVRSFTASTELTALAYVIRDRLAAARGAVTVSPLDPNPPVNHSFPVSLVELAEMATGLAVRQHKDPELWAEIAASTEFLLLRDDHDGGGKSVEYDEESEDEANLDMMRVRRAVSAVSFAAASVGEREAYDKVMAAAVESGLLDAPLPMPKVGE